MKSGGPVKMILPLHRTGGRLVMVCATTGIVPMRVCVTVFPTAKIVVSIQKETQLTSLLMRFAIRSGTVYPLLSPGQMKKIVLRRNSYMCQRRTFQIQEYQESCSNF